MGIKFDEIYESVVSRYQVGGYLPGDIVKFRPDYKSCDCYKAMHSTMKEELDNLVKSGLNIKVIQVGDKLSGVSAGNQHKTADNAVITVAGDQGGGRIYGSIAVKPEMLDIVDSNNPNPTVPDQFRRDDEKYLSGKTEEWKADQQNITRVTDKGNGKNTPTDLKLAGEGTKFKRDSENLAMLYEFNIIGNSGENPDLTKAIELFEKLGGEFRPEEESGVLYQTHRGFDLWNNNGTWQVDIIDVKTGDTTNTWTLRRFIQFAELLIAKNNLS